MGLTFAPVPVTSKKPAAAPPAHSRPGDGRHAGSMAPQVPTIAEPIQTKLAINLPGDEYEQEADRISERVMRMPEPQVQRACDCGGGCPQCQAEQAGRESERVQTRSAGPGGPVGAEAPPGVHEVLRLPGQPLDAATRAFMEPRFGHDFSGVRVHADAAAAQSAREINALAYTVGHDIVFGGGRFTPGASEGRQLLAHELAHVIQQSGGSPGSLLPQVQRKCHASELGPPKPDCTPSQQGSVGWMLSFKVGCDELLPGQEAEIEKPKPGYKLKIHGFASREGDPAFNEDLSCHRANRVADLVRARRPDCPIVGTFKHGASPVSAPGVVPDLNPPDFWRSVMIEQAPPDLEPGELWIDPKRIINEGWALHTRAAGDPTQANLDAAAARRAQIRSWLDDVSKTLAPPDAQLTRRNIDEYRHFYASAEQLWIAIDKLLALRRHPAATQDTHDAWVGGTGPDQGSRLHAQNIPQGARYHIDIFGEGYFPGAINIGMGGTGSLAGRKTTTGVQGTPIPNLVYRRFSSSTPNHIPIDDHVADLVTSESGPIGFPGLAEEIARIIAPGGIIILYNPESEEQYHDKVAKATGGTITKTRDKGAIESRIVVPGP
jgi:hypothetical protein